VTLDEGYIKYESHWTPGPATHVTAARDLERWRRPLYEAQLIGEYTDHGIGYGNISVRRGTGGLFLISGTQTGHLPVTDESNYSLVTDCDIRANIVRCSGPRSYTHTAPISGGASSVSYRPLIRRLPTARLTWPENLTGSTEWKACVSQESPCWPATKMG